MGRYIYYADFDCGSLINSSLEGLCMDIRRKFNYLFTIPENLTYGRPLTPDDMIEWNTLSNTLDSIYIRRHIFGRHGRGYRTNLLNSYAFVQLGYEYDITISRMVDDRRKKTNKQSAHRNSIKKILDSL